MEDLVEYLGRRRPEEDGTGVLGISRRQSELLCGVAGDSDAASEILTAEDCPGESSPVLLGTIRHIFIWNANLAFLHLLPIDFPFPNLKNLSQPPATYKNTGTREQSDKQPLPFNGFAGEVLIKCKSFFQVGLDSRDG